MWHASVISIINFFPVFTFRTTNQLTLLFERQKKFSAIIIPSSNEWHWRWIRPFPGNHRRSKLLFWWLLVTAESTHFLISSTYPDGTLSSTRHTEMPFDHLTVNFMLFFFCKDILGLHQNSSFYFAWLFCFCDQWKHQHSVYRFDLLKYPACLKLQICMPAPTHPQQNSIQ